MGSEWSQWGFSYDCWELLIVMYNSNQRDGLGVCTGTGPTYSSPIHFAFAFRMGKFAAC